jgi:preprotein translocase subunit YajC
MEVTLFDFFVRSAYAQTPAPGPSQGGAGMLVSFVPFILIFILFYFLLIMPQQKRTKKKKEMIDSLKKGDRVMTSGGMIGTVVTLSIKVVTIQVAEGTRIKVNRSYVEEVLEESGEEEK